MAKANKYEGETFNGILFLRRCPSGRPGRWIARCHCGKEWSVSAKNVARGLTRSCGCATTTLLRKARGWNQDAARPEYGPWRSMKERCRNPRHNRYAIYGGRGVKVCERWLTFANFLADMGPRPSPKHSLDRINAEGNYEPGNVRWATSREQNQNRRDNQLFEFQGRQLCLPEWSRDTGINLGTLWRRINSGWTIERALTQPARGR